MNRRIRGGQVRQGLAAAIGSCLVLAGTMTVGAQRSQPEKVGTAAPAFTATLLDGSAINSKDLLGKVVVLKFWYVACGPCRVEIPHLNKLVDEFAGQPVVFLGFALDPPEKLRLFLEEMPYRYQVVPDAERLSEVFDIQGRYPTHIVIDRQGKIAYFGFGGSPQTAGALRPVIRSALGSSSSS